MSWEEDYYKDREESRRDEEIEMSNIQNSDSEFISPKKSKFQCLNFMKKTWAKFTETKEVDPDDLNSLDMYYLRKHPILDFDNEKGLVKHILKLGDAGFIPNRRAIRLLAYQFAENLELRHNVDHENEMAGGAWFRSFIERTPELSIRQAGGLSVARAQELGIYIFFIKRL